MQFIWHTSLSVFAAYLRYLHSQKTSLFSKHLFSTLFSTNLFQKKINIIYTIILTNVCFTNIINKCVRQPYKARSIQQLHGLIQYLPKCHNTHCKLTGFHLNQRNLYVQVQKTYLITNKNVSGALKCPVEFYSEIKAFYLWAQL